MSGQVNSHTDMYPSVAIAILHFFPHIYTSALIIKLVPVQVRLKIRHSLAVRSGNYLILISRNDWSMQSGWKLPAINNPQLRYLSALGLHQQTNNEVAWKTDKPVQFGNRVTGHWVISVLNVPKMWVWSPSRCRTVRLLLCNNSSCVSIKQKMQLLVTWSMSVFSLEE